MEKKFTINMRRKGQDAWMELINDLTGNQALKALEMNLKEDALFGEEWEYQIITE